MTKRRSERILGAGLDQVFENVQKSGLPCRICGLR